MNRAMRGRDRQTKRRVWFHRRGRFGYPHMRGAWPAIVPGAGVRGWRSFYVPINACRWIAAATCPTPRARNQSRVIAGARWLVWHCWAVVLAVAAMSVAALVVVVVGSVKGARSAITRARTPRNQQPPPPLSSAVPVIDPLLEVEMTEVFRAVEAEHYSGGAREPDGFVLDEAGDLLDPADRYAFDQAVRAREAEVRSREMDRIEADRQAHSALLDRIEALQQTPTPAPYVDPVAWVPVEVDDGTWLGPFIAAVALVVFVGYGVVAAGFVGWAGHRIDTVNTATVGVSDE